MDYHILTAIVETEKDSHVLRLGAIPMSMGGICAFNGGSGTSFGHQKYFVDVMQEQKFKFSKHGITTLVLRQRVLSGPPTQPVVNGKALK